MHTISTASIRELLTARRIIEARTLLALDDGVLASDERKELEFEIEQVHAEAEARVEKAEALEQAGWTEEAKAAYESVLLLAIDFPGIQEHVKRMDEALALTKAVQRRNRRLRQSSPNGAKASQTKQRRLTLLGGGLTVVAAGLLLLLWLAPRPQQAPLGAAAPNLAVQEPPAAPPADMPAAPTLTPPEQQPPAEPVAAPPAPEVPPVAASLPAEPPPASRPAQPAVAPQPIDATYTVQVGDSLSLIALRQLCNQGAWKKIHQRNKKDVADPQILLPGMQLQLSGIENRCPQTQPGQPEPPASR